MSISILYPCNQLWVVGGLILIIKPKWVGNTIVSYLFRKLLEINGSNFFKLLEMIFCVLEYACDWNFNFWLHYFNFFSFSISWYFLLLLFILFFAWGNWLPAIWKEGHQNFFTKMLSLAFSCIYLTNSAFFFSI